MALHIDRVQYLTIPRTTVTRLVSLAALLAKHAPEPRSADVDVALAALVAVEADARAACVARHREYGPSLAAHESELDTCVDMLLHIARDRLAHWAVFEREGIHRLAASQRAGELPGDPGFADRIAKAERASASTELLLARGLDFTRTPYAEQAEAMRILATIIAEEDVAAELADLIGPEFLAALAEAQIAYDAMVEARALRARGSAVNLRELGQALSHAIEGYVITVLAMLREDQPDNVARVRAALRPLDAVREQLARERTSGSSDGGGEAGGEGGGDPVPDEHLDELLAEQQAFARELGLDSAPTQP